jgi:hypothetical protein
MPIQTRFSQSVPRNRESGLSSAAMHSSGTDEEILGIILTVLELSGGCAGGPKSSVTLTRAGARLYSEGDHVKIGPKLSATFLSPHPLRQESACMNAPTSHAIMWSALPRPQ